MRLTLRFLALFILLVIATVHNSSSIKAVAEEAALPQKSSVIENAAPTARNMKARGKREAKRSASPLGNRIKDL